MSKVIDMQGNPYTHDSDDDVIGIRRGDLAILIGNSESYNLQFALIEQCLAALGKRCDALEKQSKPKWWKR